MEMRQGSGLSRWSAAGRKTKVSRKGSWKNPDGLQNHLSTGHLSHHAHGAIGKQRPLSDLARSASLLPRAMRLAMVAN